MVLNVQAGSSSVQSGLHSLTTSGRESTPYRMHLIS